MPCAIFSLATADGIAPEDTRECTVTGRDRARVVRADGGAATVAGGVPGMYTGAAPGLVPLGAAWGAGRG